MEEQPNLLLVDDEQAITANLAPFLERAGFHVRTAADGEAGLQLVRETAPDLVVMDVICPGWTAAKPCADCGGRATGRPSFC